MKNPSQEDIARGLAYAWTLVLASDEVEREEAACMVGCFQGTPYTSEYSTESLKEVSKEAVILCKQKGIDYVIDRITELIPEEAYFTLLSGIHLIIKSDEKISDEELEMASKILDALNVPRIDILRLLYVAVDLAKE